MTGQVFARLVREHASLISAGPSNSRIGSLVIASRVFALSALGYLYLQLNDRRCWSTSYLSHTVDERNSARWKWFILCIILTRSHMYRFENLYVCPRFLSWKNGSFIHPDVALFYPKQCTFETKRITSVRYWKWDVDKEKCKFKIRRKCFIG